MDNVGIMYNVNNSAPKTDPWETTLITGHQLEEDSFKNAV